MTLLPFICDTCKKVFGWHMPYGFRIDIELQCKSCYRKAVQKGKEKERRVTLINNTNKPVRYATNQKR